MKLSFSDRFVFGSLYIVRGLANRVNIGKDFFENLNNRYLYRLNSKLGLSGLREQRNVGSVDRVRNVTSQEFLDDYYSKAKPVVIEGLFDSWPALKKWNFNIFKEKHGNAIFPFQMIKHKGEIDFRVNENNFTLREIINQFEKDEVKTYLPFGQVFNVIPELKKDVDYNAIKKFVKIDKEINSQIFFGAKGSITQVHCSAACNLFLQIQGRKTWKLFHPSLIPLIYPEPNFPIDSPAFKSSYYYYEDGKNFDNFPLVRYLDYVEVTLNPGDVLYIPPFWWHWVFSHDNNISLSNWWFVPGIFLKSSNTLGLSCLYSIFKNKNKEVEGNNSFERFNKSYVRKSK